MSVQPADSAGQPTTRQGLRVVPAHPCEPRYDDELPAGSPQPGDHALTLPLGHQPRHGLRLVATPGSQEITGSLRPSAIRRLGPPATPTSTSAPGGATAPAPRVWAARLVKALCEVASGDRPLTQLTGHLTSDVYFALEQRALAGTGTGWARGRRGPAGVVRSVHVCVPADGVAEVSAVVSRPGRVTALALRLERQGNRWLCTALQTG